MIEELRQALEAKEIEAVQLRQEFVRIVSGGGARAEKPEFQ